MVLSVVAAHIQALMGLNTDIGPERPKPDYAYQHGRRQYDTSKIIKALSSDTSRVPLSLGITRYDICTPILSFVYGESQLGGRSALISLYRITDEKIDVTCTRAAKIGLHEVGHLLGIGHCRTGDCLMCFSSTLDKLDQLKLWFCDACTYEISRSLRHLFTEIP
jgi:archaemetzincin